MKKLGITLLSAAAAFIAVDALLLEHLFFQVKKFKIGNPAGTRYLRILHLSDLHFGSRLGLHHHKLIGRIKKLQPDVLFITGDMVDQNGKLEPLETFLRALDASLPKLGVPGNHDYVSKADVNAIRKVFDNCNGKLLVNETRSLLLANGEEITITGFDDLLQGAPDPKEALAGSTGKKHHFGLIHSPLHFDRITEYLNRRNGQKPKNPVKINYFFAGHNHGGQITLGNYTPVLPQKSGSYIEGWYSKEEAPYLYLSRGFGTSSLPIRFMAPAEVGVFDYYF